MSENRCISCGEIIPEGMQVCPVCMARAIRRQELEEIKFDAEQEARQRAREINEGRYGVL